MDKKKLRLQLLEGKYAICRLPGAAPLPGWAEGEGFLSISRFEDQLSIVCRADRVPEDIQCDRGWLCLRFIGPFSLYETGIVLSVVQPLSEGGIGVFVVSSYDGEHLLFKDEDFVHAQMLLQNAGHTVA
jgi:uncharacterized protein